MIPLKYETFKQMSTNSGHNILNIIRNAASGNFKINNLRPKMYEATFSNAVLNKQTGDETIINKECI